LSFNQKDKGVVAGGQIGYNWQIAPAWVLGIEADLSSLHLRANSSQTILDDTGIPLVCAGGQPSCGFSVMSRNLDWVGTVRGRLGYAWDR
jgi:outer membrane immunogenic protein